MWPLSRPVRTRTGTGARPSSPASGWNRLSLRLCVPGRPRAGRRGTYHVRPPHQIAGEPESYIGATSRDIRTPEKPMRGMDAYELYFLMWWWAAKPETAASDSANQVIQDQLHLIALGTPRASVRSRRSVRRSSCVLVGNLPWKGGLLLMVEMGSWHGRSPSTPPRALLQRIVHGGRVDATQRVVQHDCARAPACRSRKMPC